MKRRVQLLLFIMGVFFLGLIPSNVAAMACTYKVTTPGLSEEIIDIKFSIKINDKGDVELTKPFKKPTAGGDLFPDSTYFSTRTFQFSDDFDKTYKSQAVDKDTGSGKCPEIVIRDGTGNQNSGIDLCPDSNICIFPSTHAVASDDLHYTIETDTQESEKGDNITAVTEVGKCVVNVKTIAYDVATHEGIGDETHTATFYLYSNNAKEWSFDGSSKKRITLNDYEIQLGDVSQARISSPVLGQIYQKNLQLNCPDLLYACKTQIDNTSDEANYDLYLSPSCRKTEHLGDVSLDGMNQALTCSGIFTTQDEGSVYWLLQTILNYIKLAGPILVVLLSSVDFIKAVMSSDENAMKTAQKKLMVRLVAAIALFLLPSLVQLIISLLGGIADPNCLIQ